MPYLTPHDLPEDVTCRPLLIPDDTEWLGIISGALTELVKLHNWEQSDGGITREQAVARTWILLNNYWAGECEGGAVAKRIYRIGIRGQLQFSWDSGETWEDAEGAITEPLPPRTEPTEDDKKCLAAANAEYVLRQVYLELLEAFNTDSTISYGIAVFAAILGLLIAAFWLPLAVITALINFALGAFGAAWAGLQFLNGDDWTVNFQDDLICLLRNNATVTDGVVTFDYMAVRDNLSDADGEVALKFWVFYILQVIGAEGLNAAGATTAVENYTCLDNCGQWCHEYDFTAGAQGWTVLNNRTDLGNYVAGVGWESEDTFGGAGAVDAIYIQSPVFASAAHVVKVEVEYSGGGSNYFNVIARSSSWGAGTAATPRAGVYPSGDPIALDRANVLYMSFTMEQPRVPALTIKKLRVYGVGTDPFGVSNC